MERHPRKSLSILAIVSTTSWLRCAGWAFVAVVFLAPCAYGGTIRTDRNDDLYRQLASQPEYQSVGHFEWNEGPFPFSGSGVLIAEDWVLTAGHVVGGTDNMGGGIDRLRFRVGSRTHTVEEWIPHPVWISSGGSLDDGVDLGLVRLTRPALVEPVKIYDLRNERGEVGTIVGFGSTGTGGTGSDIASSEKRAGHNVMDIVRSGLIEVDFDNPNRRRDSAFGSNTPLDLEYLAATGDSGGGLFIDTPSGAELVGITSYTAAFDAEINSDYGDIAGFVRVSSYMDWIEEIVGDLDAVLGDFNSDKLLTAEDIDILTEKIGLGIDSVDPVFDLNGDGEVTVRDRKYWVENVFKTKFGDINLDRRVDQEDLITLRDMMFKSDTNWATGDFNGDGNTDGSDWNIWFTKSLPEQSSSLTAPVPEPRVDGLLLLCLGLLLRFKDRRRARVLHRD